MSNQENPTLNQKQILYETNRQDWLNYLADNNLSTIPALVIDASSRCDYGQCPACYFMDDEGQRCPNQDLALSTVKEWKQIFTESGIIPQQVWLPGGEPTLNPQIIEIINSLKTLIPEICLVSNGFNLANYAYAKELLLKSQLTEIDITINGANPDVHNLMMAPLTSLEWQKVPNLALPDLIKNVFTGQIEMNNFAKAYQALINIAKISEELKKPLIIGLNLNMNHGADLDKLLEKVDQDGGRVDSVIFQSMQASTRSRNREKNNPSFSWQIPTAEMINKYLKQAEQLLNSGKIKSASIIDPLPKELVDTLDLTNNPIYQPSDTPAIGVDGKFRTNVLI